MMFLKFMVLFIHMNYQYTPKPSFHTGPQAHFSHWPPNLVFTLAPKPSFHTSPQAQFTHWPPSLVFTLAPKPSFHSGLQAQFPHWPLNLVVSGLTIFFCLGSKPSFPCSQIKIKEKLKKENSTHASTHPCMHHHIGSKRNHNISCIIKLSIILDKILENHFQKK